MTSEEEEKEMDAETISIVRKLSRSEVVQDLMGVAYSWAERYRGDKQDAQAMELALRFEFELARFRLLTGFSAYQELSGGTEIFPWNQELQQVIEAIIGEFRERVFSIGKHYPEFDFYFPLVDVLANLRGGLQEVCRPWLTESIEE